MLSTISCHSSRSLLRSDFSTRLRSALQQSTNSRSVHPTSVRSVCKRVGNVGRSHGPAVRARFISRLPFHSRVKSIPVGGAPLQAHLQRQQCRYLTLSRVQRLPDFCVALQVHPQGVVLQGRALQDKVALAAEIKLTNEQRGAA
jgi:hypothetical protein